MSLYGLKCKKFNYCCQPGGHKVTRDLKIITDSRILFFFKLICKGPKYRFPLQINVARCREEIAGALEEIYNR